MINIPQLFLSSQFSLSDSSTFNLVFPGIIPSPSSSFSPIHVETDKARSTSTSSDKSEGSHRRQSASSSSAAGHKSTANGTVRFGRASLSLQLSLLRPCCFLQCVTSVGCVFQAVDQFHSSCSARQIYALLGRDRIVDHSSVSNEISLFP
jgi:hypothetical protein